MGLLRVVISMRPHYGSHRSGAEGRNIFHRSGAEAQRRTCFTAEARRRREEHISPRRRGGTEKHNLFYCGSAGINKSSFSCFPLHLSVSAVYC